MFLLQRLCRCCNNTAATLLDVGSSQLAAAVFVPQNCITVHQHYTFTAAIFPAAALQKIRCKNNFTPKKCTVRLKKNYRNTSTAAAARTSTATSNSQGWVCLVGYTIWVPGYQICLFRSSRVGTRVSSEYKTYPRVHNLQVVGMHPGIPSVHTIRILG